MATIMSSGGADGTTRRCDAHCHKATQPECKCICGGRYHGCARDQSEGPRDVIEAELMHRGLDKDTLSAEEKSRIAQEALEMFGQYKTVTVHDFSTGGVQDALDFMSTFHEAIKCREGKIAQRAREKRGKLSDLRGAEYMQPLIQL